MLKRYRTGKYLAPCYFFSNTPGSTTALTADFSVVIKGAALATVTFKVTYYSASTGAPFYSVEGTTYALNDEFTKTLDGSGAYTLPIQLGFNGGGLGQGINVTLTIISVSAGKLGTQLTQAEEYTTS